MFKFTGIVLSRLSVWQCINRAQPARAVRDPFRVLSGFFPVVLRPVQMVHSPLVRGKPGIIVKRFGEVGEVRVTDAHGDFSNFDVRVLQKLLGFFHPFLGDVCRQRHPDGAHELL